MTRQSENVSTKSVWLVTLLLALLIPAGLTAQRNCKKGIPCGGTCISATKTCHVGTTQPSPQPDTGLHRVSRPDESQETLVDRLVGSPAQYFVGSVDGVVYYLASCTTAIQKLSDDEKIYFVSEAEAKSKGYRRSKAKGC